MTIKKILAVAMVVIMMMAGDLATAAAAPVSGVRARLLDVPVLRGEFEQAKTLQGFKNPLKSKGDFLLARGRGVVWTTRSPFASTIVLTGKQLTVRQADGSSRPLAGQGGSQAIQTANALLMALLGGQVEVLSSQFTVTETLLPGKDWRLLLVPKPGGLQAVFKRIELQGDDHVRGVVLEETNGDRTEIHFIGLRDAPAKLDATEAKQFD